MVVGRYSVHVLCNYYSRVSAISSAQKFIESPADTNRLRIWQKRTSESRSLSWRLLAGYEYSIKTTFPLKRKRRKRERERKRERRK